MALERIINVGINGFGRIGRQLIGAMAAKGVLGKRINVKAVVDVVNDAKYFAYQMKYDSVHGRFPGQVMATAADILEINGNPIKCLLATKELKALPWKDLGVDYVIESTGLFTDAEKAQGHLEAGAQKVIISAPGKGAVKTIVMGVNHEEYDPAAHNIVSNASCTTNCLAPVAYVLNQPEIGIELPDLF